MGSPDKYDDLRTPFCLMDCRRFPLRGGLSAISASQFGKPMQAATNIIKSKPKKRIVSQQPRIQAAPIEKLELDGGVFF